MRAARAVIEHRQCQLLAFLLPVRRGMLQDLLHGVHPVKLLLGIHRHVTQGKNVLRHCNAPCLGLLYAAGKLLLPLEDATRRVYITPFPAVCPRQPQPRAKVALRPILATPRGCSPLRAPDG